MGYRKRLLGIAAAAVLVGVLPGIAAANTTEAIAETGGMNLTLPGVPIDLDVVLDDFGNIDTVSFDFGFTKDHESDHKVTFAKTDDGSTVVKVKAEGAKLTAKVKTSNFGDLVGDHVWTGDIFGTGVASTVSFTIVQVGSGDSAYLEITSVAVTSPFESSVEGPRTEAGHGGDEDEYESKATIEFFDNGYTKSLKIEVETEHEDEEGDDHEGFHAKLKIELRGKDRQELLGDEAIGTHTWDGLLCDGTNASVTYTVAVDGSLTLDVVSVAGEVTYTVDDDHGDDDDHELRIRFTDTNGDDDAKLRVEAEWEDGSIELSVKSKTTDSCDDGDHDDDDGDHDDDDEGDDDSSDDDDDDDRDDDDD